MRQWYVGIRESIFDETDKSGNKAIQRYNYGRNNFEGTAEDKTSEDMTEHSTMARVEFNGIARFGHIVPNWDALGTSQSFAVQGVL